MFKINTPEKVSLDAGSAAAVLTSTAATQRKYSIERGKYKLKLYSLCLPFPALPSVSTYVLLNIGGGRAPPISGRAVQPGWLPLLAVRPAAQPSCHKDRQPAGNTLNIVLMLKRI